ncbi:hypothetical protein V5735_06465 (plasmid) [Haladaptatus sp. SPP-AMP-3]|uniref:hypothetical protein n=1 Tax=Haladaptatus sp. SPP-AMP-3 TaxID=3121295 RepID=UPI003C2D7FD4
MKRRHVLQTLAVGTALGSGCLDSTNDSASNPGETSSTTKARTDSDRSPSVESVETFPYAVRLNDLGTSPTVPTTTVAELSDRERRVVERAIDGGYETDDPPEWLVRFLADTSRVTDDGTTYRLDSSLPTYTITAEAVAEAAVDGRIASRDAYEKAVTHDGRVMSGMLRLARDDGVELEYVWPSLRTFFDRYEAARYHGEVISFAIHEDDPGSPYDVTANSLSVPEMADGSVWDVRNESEAVKTAVRAAGSESGAYALRDPPSGLIDALDAHDYAYLDGTFYTAYVEARGSLPISLSATVPEPGRLRVELTNETGGECRVSSGPPRPFGVVRCHRRGVTESRHLLWTDAYEESGHVSTDGKRVRLVNTVALVTNLATGETTGETYDVPTDLAAGAYVVAGNVGVTTEDGDSTAPYRIVFTVG